MKYFTLLLLLVTIGSYLTAKELTNVKPATQSILPKIIKNYHLNIKDSFKKRENANLLIMYLTGTKEKISHQTSKNLKEAQLTHLLSPGGIHLSLLIFIFFYFFKKRMKKTNKFVVVLEISFLLGFFFLEGFWSIKRLVLLRLFLIGKKLLQLSISIDWIFFLVFIWAYLNGHFAQSPLGYLYSFSYLGTLITLRDEPKFRLVLGLFLIELIMSLILCHRLSFIALLFNFLFILLFEGLFILSFIFYMSFWCLNWNFIEPFIQGFKVLASYSLYVSHISLTTSSPFLLLALSLIFYQPHKIKGWAFILCLYLHSNTSLGPTINLSQSLTNGDKISKR